MCGEVSPCFHPGVRAQHCQGLVRAAQSNSHLLVYPPEWAAQSPCQALGGSSWHRELCWAFAGKTENLPPGNSCVECSLSVLTINHCTELQPHWGSGRRVLVTTPGVSSGGFRGNPSAAEAEQQLLAHLAHLAAAGWPVLWVSLGAVLGRLGWTHPSLQPRALLGIPCSRLNWWDLCDEPGEGAAADSRGCSGTNSAHRGC